LLGGELFVDSALGRGSVFSLSIPTGPLAGVPLIHGSASDVVHSHPSLKRTPPRSLPPCKILLVEDGATNRKLISLILERAGAKVRCAENGRAGVETASSEPFDLILMDMQMPVMDGYRATRELRHLGCTAPIVALTAHAMSGDEQKCRDAGCSGYLTKPIDPHRLLATVADALNYPGAEPNQGESMDSCERPLVSALPLDDPEFREIADEFVVRLEEKLVALRAAWDGGDRRLASEIAHWIKGSGGTAGFGEFTEPAAALEMSIRQGSSQAAAEQIQRLVNLFRRIPTPTSR
jgi:CheY-like chemotaxis protein/HPt (histidine-containing phosphotransfer) domain-containing protein